MEETTMTRTLPIFAILGLSLSLVMGCPKTVDDTDTPEGDTDTDTDTDSDTDADTDTDTDTDPTGTSCADIQNFDGISEGDTVTLSGVCVTSPVAYNGQGFFVQDDGGGEWSGMFVYLGSVKASVTTGDKIDVTGEVTEYYDLTELSVMDAGDISVTGSCNPAATTLQASPSDFEPYESVLITVLDINVTTDADDYGEHETDFGDMTIDDMFWTYEGGAGDSLTSLTGPLNYSYDVWKIEPRGSSDVAM
jgi:predicted extracellular nuclease